MRSRNVILATLALTLFVSKVSAQVQPSLPSRIINKAIDAPRGAGQSINGAFAEGAQWLNIGLAKGIYAQMRSGTETVLHSELFGAICLVSLIIAFIALSFRFITWLVHCARLEMFLPTIFLDMIAPIFLIILLANPTGQGFALQRIVLGTGDLLNGFQTYILQKGGTATKAGGSAVRQATVKSQVEQSIRAVQIDCAATLNETDRKSCYQDGYVLGGRPIQVCRSSIA
jgi:hypothetical protein